jgi:hypothetical protein
MSLALVGLLTFKDAKGAVATTEFNFPSSVTLANAKIFAQQMAILYNNVTTGVITRIGVAVLATLPGALRASADADSDVEEGARFQFRTDGGFYTGFRIPTFDEAKILSGTKQVDTADTDVAALVAVFEDGLSLTGVGGSGTVQPCDKREDPINALDAALEQFVKSR